MKKTTVPILGVLSLLILANYSAQENTSEGNKKHSVNFYGTLAARNNKTFKCENISIAHLYKQIPLYEVPGTQDRNEQEHTFNTNPKSGIITKIDLSETDQISVPHPKTIWTYQRKKGARKTEYIEITIVSNDKKKTRHHYIIDLGRKLICDEINEAGPIEKEVPFKAIKTLTIEGYKYRDTDIKRQKTEATKPCVARAA